MKKQVGLWVDHERAFIVSLVDGSEQILIILSDVESHIKTLGGSRTASPYGPQDIAAEKKLERKRKQHLHKFYQKIISTFKDAQQILIFGPGAAKSELEKEINKLKELHGKIVGIESSDKMTEGQIIARVKNYFKEKK